MLHVLPKIYLLLFISLFKALMYVVINYQKGGERDQLKLNHSYKGREHSGGECKKPQMLGVQEERSHMSLRGERHVLIYLSALALFLLFELRFSVPYLLPVSHARFRGSKTSKGKKSLNLLHIFTFGDMSISNVVLSTHSTCHPSLGTLVVSFVCSGQQVYLCYLTLFSQVRFILSQLKTTR